MRPAGEESFRCFFKILMESSLSLVIGTMLSACVVEFGRYFRLAMLLEARERLPNLTFLGMTFMPLTVYIIFWPLSYFQLNISSQKLIFSKVTFQASFISFFSLISKSFYSCFYLKILYSSSSASIAAFVFFLQICTLNEFPVEDNLLYYIGGLLLNCVYFFSLSLLWRLLSVPKVSLNSCYDFFFLKEDFIL